MFKKRKKLLIEKEILQDEQTLLGFYKGDLLEDDA